jgi:subtilisin-like proprotein convertase family protein
MAKKLKILFLVVVCGTAGNLPAALFTDNANMVIPDGGGALNTLSRSVNVTGMGTRLADISVILNVSGGYNGDLHAYLRAPDGSMSVLLNRVGRTSGNSFGYENTGFNVTLSDHAAYDIHGYQTHSPSYNGSGQLTGMWQPDARNHDPAITLDTSTRNAYLSSFNDSNPNGNWTLVFSDWAAGEASTLVSWSLDITAVPEPVTVALGIFGAIAGIGKLFSWRSRTGLTALTVQDLSQQEIA